MKRLIRSSHTLLIAWLCLVTALDFKSVSGFVLCLGEDGHIDLENSVDDKCGVKDAPDAHNPVLLPVAEDHCGDCLDVRLSGFVPQSLKHRSLENPMGVAIPTVPLAILSQSFHPVVLPFPQVRGPSRELISLRTIVILV